MYPIASVPSKIHSLLCRLKINHMMDNQKMHLFLTQWTVQLQTLCDVNEAVTDADEAVPDVGEAVPNVANLFIMTVKFS
jgi:hypothetical protein